YVVPGREVAGLRGHDNPVLSAVFSPDGRRVVTASVDNTARLWDVGTMPDGNLFSVACTLLPDNDLTDIARDYGFSNLEPICESDPPPPDASPHLSFWPLPWVPIRHPHSRGHAASLSGETYLTGNLPSFPAIYPDTLAPIVRTERDGERRRFPPPTKLRQRAGHEC